jgi:hypothetical protein
MRIFSLGTALIASVLIGCSLMISSFFLVKHDSFPIDIKTHKIIVSINRFCSDEKFMAALYDPIFEDSKLKESSDSKKARKKLLDFCTSEISEQIEALEMNEDKPFIWAEFLASFFSFDSDKREFETGITWNELSKLNVVLIEKQTPNSQSIK